MKYAFAGDRIISCNILNFLITKGYKPSALFVSDGKSASHAEELIHLSELEDSQIFRGNAFKNPTIVNRLRKLNLDYVFGIHFPYIVPKEVIEIPNIGFLNLHPSYLPYNKGWHTPSWAILDKKTYGATLHFMAEELDEGDIIHQKKIEVLSSYTANSLYQRVLKLEEEVFLEAFDDLITLKPKREKQQSKGTSHNKKDLLKIQELDLNQNSNIGDLIDKLRALTTNDISEAAFFKSNGKRIGIQIKMFELGKE